MGISERSRLARRGQIRLAVTEVCTDDSVKQSVHETAGKIFFLLLDKYKNSAIIYFSTRTHRVLKPTLETACRVQQYLADGEVTIIPAV